MTYDPATIYSFVRIRSLPRCSLQREWSTASKKKGEKKNVPLYIHIVKGVNRRFWRVDADGWAAPAIPVISTYVRTYVAGVCSISCISWRGAATCICSCFMRANYYTPLWRATRVENETERGGRGLRIRRSKGISSKYLRASINILHTSASPSPRLYPSNSYFAKLFANSFPRKIVQQLGMNPVRRGFESFETGKSYICSLDWLD